MQTEETRAKIQASQIINRLENHMFGEIELSRTQIDAAKILLAKCLPDLQSIVLSGDKDNPIIPSEIKIVLIDAAQAS